MDVKIRQLPDWVVAMHKARAEHAGRSLEEELRILLTEAATKTRRDFAERAAAFRNRLQQKYGTLPDSAEEIRADREGRR